MEQNNDKENFIGTYLDLFPGSSPEENLEIIKLLQSMDKEGVYKLLEEKYQESIESPKPYISQNEYVFSQPDLSHYGLKKNNKHLPDNSNNSLDPDFTFKTEYNGLEIFQNTIITVPKLVDPFLQKVGLAALVGESDCGKSTFLSFLALHIALDKKTFLDHPLCLEHKKVIYVSTEDDIYSISPKIKNQLNSFGEFDKSLLKNIDFIFDTNKLLENLEKKLKKHPRDLIIIDAFGDIFPDDLNQNNKVRNFLDKYQNLAKKYNCLVLFLHHIKKNSSGQISKDNVIGSQGFEAKMRVVLQLKPKKNGDIQLWVLKGNFIQRETKQKSFIYELKNDQSFFNTGKSTSIRTTFKKDNKAIQDKVIELATSFISSESNKFHTIREIVSKLNGTEFEAKRTTVNNVVLANKTEIETRRKEKLGEINKSTQ